MAPSERNIVERMGGRAISAVSYAGAVSLLLGSTLRWAAMGLVSRKVRLDRQAVSTQMVRVGVRSLGIVVLVQVFIGVILALQMTPPLAEWQQQAQVARIIGVAGFRMLGPIITAVVLSGFAGASIAAEIGTMAVSEEIEAMEAMALNPVRFLVVPRVLATAVMLVLLSAVADWMIALGGYLTSLLVLGPESYVGYWQNMRDQLRMKDLVTGLVQAGLFGMLISGIACHEGLSVRGGAEGVGRATTLTVVYSIVAIIAAAGVCTMVFFALDL